MAPDQFYGDMIMKKYLVGFVLAIAVLVGMQAIAQSPSGSVQAIAPLTRDLGSIKTLTAVTPSTVVSTDQTGYNVSRIVCVMAISTKVGSSTATFTIQNKDAASGRYYDLVTSGTVTSASTATAISAGGGVTTTANVGAGIPIAKTWRVSTTISTATSLTGTIGCSVQ